MERRYWLHRISHCMEISYPLLEKEYLSIGFSDFLLNKSFLDDMLSDNNDKWDLFEKENIAVWGDKLYRTRYNLWRFLCEFAENDYVIVPSWGTFSVYEISGKPRPAGQVIGEEFTGWYGKKVSSYGEDKKYIVDENKQIVDLGFVIPVKPVEKDIPRSDYCENALLSRMKIQQTNTNMDGLSSEIEKAISRFREKKPINIYAETVESLSYPLDDIIKRIVDNDQFEKLIKSYFEKIGADSVEIPSKRDGKGEADGDIVARFDALKLIIYVQAKHHEGKTGEKAVFQIAEYTDQKKEQVHDLDYSSLSWVISSAEEFSEKAIASASAKNVRLINGQEFRKMLIDAGISKLAVEFS